MPEVFVLICVCSERNRNCRSWKENIAVYANTTTRKRPVNSRSKTEDTSLSEGISGIPGNIGNWLLIAAGSCSKVILRSFASFLIVPPSQISPEVDSTVRICAGCAERVDAQHAFRTRDLHCNSYVENGLEDKEDEDVCRFCLKADSGAALVELFPGGGGSVADEVQTVRDCLGVEINSWDMVTKICGDCVGGVEELAEFRAEFSPTAVPVKLEDVTDSSDSYSIGSENGEGGEDFESDSSKADNGEKRGGKAEGHGTVAAVDWK
ncbi:uncharacterized protein LOC120431944 [Culex pipiens pallens]|uniref:uncharacterized protein LOC120431944 n=1 Tax=Culex pipiens pallens TaxID=42434 RepID=UPI0022AA03FD|nr:uncharacterized protein LOC120431944 [Culex pipiens pallens]